MAITRHEIDSYRLFINSGDSNQGAVINCYRGNAYKGSLLFHQADQEGNVPTNNVLTGDLLSLHFREDQLSVVIDTLRYEKPPAYLV